MSRSNDHNNFAGILISGGKGTETSVEVYSPGVNYHCLLPPLPDKRGGHTSDGMTLCGGYKTERTCITFSSGKWVTSHALTEKRVGHTSWYNKEEGKIILMGGMDQSEWFGIGVNTTETITEDEYNGVPGFSIKYPMM